VSCVCCVCMCMVYVCVAVGGDLVGVEGCSMCLHWGLAYTWSIAMTVYVWYESTWMYIFFILHVNMCSLHNIVYCIYTGYTDELTALEELVSNKQRGVNESFMRQTVHCILYICCVLCMLNDTYRSIRQCVHTLGCFTLLISSLTR